MRQMILQLPDGQGDRATEVLKGHGVMTLTRMQGTDRHGRPVDVVLASVPNAKVGPVLGELEDHAEVGEVEAVVPSEGVFAFEPPAGRAPEQLVDVTSRSPLEVVLAGRQSVGGWIGFLSYAATAGVVVWIGLFLETPFLLTAAMLLAPFAGPAMNTAIGIVSGDGDLLRSSVMRYAAGIGLTAVVSLGMTLLIGQSEVTGMAADSVTLSNVAVLLPLAAGIAGALFLIQSEHSSLVSGAAVGILVAAALAPPVGTIGMAIGVGRWDLVGRGGIVLVLQLAGITLTASLVLLANGLNPSGYRYATGRRSLVRAGVGIAALVVATLVGVQQTSGPDLQRSSVAREASQLTGRLLGDDPRVELLELTADVPSADTPGPPRVIVTVTVELDPSAGTDATAVEEELASQLRRQLAAELEDVVPLVDLTVLTPP